MFTVPEGSWCQWHNAVCYFYVRKILVLPTTKCFFTDSYYTRLYHDLTPVGSLVHVSTNMWQLCVMKTVSWWFPVVTLLTTSTRTSQSCSFRSLWNYCDQNLTTLSLHCNLCQQHVKPSFKLHIHYIHMIQKMFLLNLAPATTVAVNSCQHHMKPMHPIEAILSLPSDYICSWPSVYPNLLIEVLFTFWLHL
jgi:hypothetical protein